VRGDARWGWHQLDNRWVSRLIAAADVGPGDLVLDVGAGTGAITAQLLRRGASVVAIELHPRRLHTLRERFAGLAVTVVRADATDLRLPRRPFKVVANPPFATTTALLRRLTAPSSRLEQASLILPAWAAARWAAGRGTCGATSRATFAFARGPRVPAGAFHPAPPADPAILLVHRR
jgi:23S rRNA (adenine-N6)-dimethyltransferase